jgi:hypothetical protein
MAKRRQKKLTMLERCENRRLTTHSKIYNDKRGSYFEGLYT